MTAEYCYKVARAFAEVAEGLQYAHTRGIIHRDLKPSNLILDREGRLRILDFGLAHLEGQQSLTASGDLLGTVMYMSPEQVMARRIPIDRRTDIYSLGATLCEPLAWRPAFEGKSAQDTLSQIIFRDPESPRRRNPRIPKDLETIVLKCVRKAPGDRYATAEGLAQDLWRFVRGDPIEARPQAAVEIIARKAWRNRGKVAAACLVLLLALASGLIFHRYRQDAYAEKLARYRGIIFTAIGKMELGRPARRAGGRNAEEGGSADALASRSGEESREGLGSVAHAAGLELAEAVPDPVEEAAEDLRKAAELFPGRPEALFHLSRAERLLDREEDAEATLDQALRLDPGFLPALIARRSPSGKPEEEVAAGLEKSLGASMRSGFVKDSLLAYRARAQGDWPEAEKALGRLLVYCPADPESPEPYLGFRMQTLLERGRARLEAGDLDGALEDFLAARTLWPDLAEPVLLLGKALLRKGDPGRAERKFEEFFGETERKDDFALAAARFYHELHEYERGLSWADKARESARREVLRADILSFCIGGRDEALKAARRAVELDPNLALARRCLGRLLYNCQYKYEEAMAQYREAIRLDPKDAVSYNHLGSLLRHIGKREEAVEEFRKAIQIDQRNAESHNNLGSALRDQGKFDEAIVEYQKTIQLNPKSVRVRCSLGMLLKMKGKLDEAIAQFLEAIRLDSKYASAHMCLAGSYINQGKLDEGISEYREAIRISPYAGVAFINLGYALDEHGKLDEAIALYREGIQRMPLNYQLYSNLGWTLLKKNMPDEAISEFRESIRLHPKTSHLAWLASSHNGLDTALRMKGELDEAFSEVRKALELGGRDFALVSELLRSGERPDLGPEIELLINALESAVGSQGEPDPDALQALALALLWPSSKKDPQRALECARRAVERTVGGDSGATESRKAWETWWAIAAADPIKPMEEIRKAASEAASAHPGSYAADLLWALDRLREDGAVRINCGGEECREADGKLWGKDRFALGGKVQSAPSDHPVEGTEDDELYRTERSFPEDFSSGYRIPLERGRYRVALYFAEVSFREPGKRRFEVLLEKTVVLRDYEPRIDTAESFEFEQSVEDGHLDIEFIRRIDNPKISAIAIERLP